MKRKQFTPEKIIGLLRQAQGELAQGKRVGEVCSGLTISEQSYYRWCSEYGGLKLDQALRMKDLTETTARGECAHPALAESSMKSAGWNGGGGGN